MFASSEYTPLNDIDHDILQILQRDARHLTTVEIAERIGVSAGTVRNRIEKLVEQNIIEGYVPTINYANATQPDDEGVCPFQVLEVADTTEIPIFSISCNDGEMYVLGQETDAGELYRIVLGDV